MIVSNQRGSVALDARAETAVCPVYLECLSDRCSGLTDI